MAEETITPTPEPSEVEIRIKDLSGKVKTASKERDDAQALANTASAEKDEAIKERDFYASFSDVVSTHPAAKDHKDEILAKVKSGYTVEDATVSVLNKAGKLVPPPIERQSPAGGSASTTVTGSQAKSIREMTQAERKAAIAELEQKGDLAMS